MGTPRTLHLIAANSLGKWERRVRDGQTWWVGPASMLVPGVLNGSKGPLLYTAEDTRAATAAWNRVPITLGHPRDDAGNHVSANEDGVFDRLGLGFVEEPRFDGRLTAKAWVHEGWAAQVAPDVLNAIRKNEPVELSTGLGTRDEEARPGSTWNGKSGAVGYTHVARDHKPDHLAILVGQRGACSIKDGCGLGVNAFNPDQPRDSDGKFGSGGGSSSGKLSSADRSNIRKSLLSQVDEHEDPDVTEQLRTAVKEGSDSELLSLYEQTTGEKWKGTTNEGVTEDPETACESCGGNGPEGECTCPDQEEADAKTMPMMAGNLLERMWDKVVNAFLPNQPRSEVTGRIKPRHAGQGKGEAHEAAQRGYHGSQVVVGDRQRELGADAARQKAETGHNPPNWAVDEDKWEKAKELAAKNGHEEDWPYVVGIYQQMGGEVGSANNAEGGGDQTTNQDQEVAVKTRKEKVALLVNCACGTWKGKEAVLNDAKLFTDADIDKLVASTEAGQLAVNTLKEIGTALKAPDDLTVNDMPEFIKKKIAAKEDDEEEEEDDDEEKTANAGAKGRKDQPTVNLSNLTPDQIDQLAKAITGQTVSEIKANQRFVTDHREREKEIVVNKLTDHLSGAEKAARAKKLMALNLEELYDRLADRPSMEGSGRDSDDRLPLFAGRVGGPALNVDRQDEVTANDEGQVFDPCPPAKWTNNRRGRKQEQTAA